MKKILFSLLIILGMAFATVPVHAVSAQSAILIEAASGHILYEQNAQQRRPMASTTKIMTAIVAIENARLDAVVKVSTMAAHTEGSSMYLKEGEQITVEALLYGLMLSSGNDAANALAEFVGGSVESFVSLMNKKANELGLADTSFETPSGLDGKHHYSTAYDMAKLTAYAMKNDTFTKIVSTKAIELGERYLVNHNRLLFSYRYAVGVKTGYTIASGRCLVSAAEKDGVTLIAVTLDDRNDWNDHISMYEKAFSQMQKVQLCSRQDIYKVPVVGANEGYAEVLPKQDLYGFFFDNVPDYAVKVNLPRFLYAPLKEGEHVGTLTVEFTDREALQVDLTVQNKVEMNATETTWISCVFSWLRGLFRR